jgi:hypothetical protein
MLISLFVIPNLYLVFHGAKDALAARFGRARAGAVRKDAEVVPDQIEIIAK